MTDERWECPALVQLPVEGSDARRWLLTVGHHPGHVAGGSGAQYFLGDFDGYEFVVADMADHPRWVDHGPDFACPTPFRDTSAAAEEMTWIGWASNWTYAESTPPRAGEDC